MTNKQIQELIERVEKILANCQQEYSDRPIPPYVFSDALKDCKTALQEYQEVMDRVEDNKEIMKWYPEYCELKAKEEAILKNNPKVYKR